MKKYFCSLLTVMLICLTVLGGCNRRTPVIDPGTDSPSKEISTSEVQESTSEAPTEEPETTTPEPSPYEKLLSGNAANENGDIYFIKSELPFSPDDSDIIVFEEWDGNLFIGFESYITDLANFYCYDFVEGKIIAELAIQDSFCMSQIHSSSDKLVLFSYDTNTFYIYNSRLELEKEVAFPEGDNYCNYVLDGSAACAYFTGNDKSVCYRLDLSSGDLSELYRADGDYTIFINDILLNSTFLQLGFEYPDSYLYKYYSLKNSLLSDSKISSSPMQLTAYNNTDNYGVIIYDMVRRAIHIDRNNPENSREFFFSNNSEINNMQFLSNATLFTYYGPDSPADMADIPVTVCCYDAETGSRSFESVFSLASSPEDLYYYVPFASRLLYLEQYNAVIGIYGYQSPRFFLWDLNSSKKGSAENAVCAVRYYPNTEYNPDIMPFLKEKAEQTGSLYGVKILIGDDIRTDTGDYLAAPIYDTASVNYVLNLLRTSLAKFPDNFFAEFRSDSGAPLEINIAGAFTPVADNTVSTAVGLHNYNDGEQFIMLNISNIYEVQSSIYHEIYHAIDWAVVFGSAAFDSWDSLNPPDFSYDYDYAANEGNTDSQYLYYTDENGYFIDSYSKSYPSEDRARIFENAMCGNYYYFGSEHLRSKLSYIARAIREVFDDSTWPAVTEWEKYAAQFNDNY